MAANKEGIVERYLCDQVALRGGRAEKLVFQNARGAPDRWCFFPNGVVALVECKAADGRLHPLQAACLERYAAMGYTTAVVYSKDDVDVLMTKLEKVLK